MITVRVRACVSPLYLFVDLQKLLHSHFLVFGYPEGSVNAPKAASSTILIEKQILMLYLYKRRARGRHGILTHVQSNTHTHSPQKPTTVNPQGLCQTLFKSEINKENEGRQLKKYSVVSNAESEWMLSVS